MTPHIKHPIRVHIAQKITPHIKYEQKRAQAMLASNAHAALRRSSTHGEDHVWLAVILGAQLRQHLDQEETEQR